VDYSLFSSVSLSCFSSQFDYISNFIKVCLANAAVGFLTYAVCTVGRLHLKAIYKI